MTYELVTRRQHIRVRRPLKDNVLKILEIKFLSNLKCPARGYINFCFSIGSPLFLL